MLQGCVSWVKAMKDVMPDLKPPDFTALTPQDKSDLHAMLAEAGYDLMPLTIKGSDATLAASA